MKLELPSPPKRLLIRSPNWLGDAVMSTAAIERIRQRFPSTRICVLAQRKLAELWAHHPGVEQVLAIEAGESPWRLAKRLRTLQCDTALLFPNSVRSALETFFARIPQRVGYASAWRKPLLTLAVARRPAHTSMQKRSPDDVQRRLLSTSGRTRYSSTAHHIFEYLHLVGALGASTEPIGPRLEVSPAELESARNTLLAQCLQQAPGAPLTLLALNPGAEYGPAKRWPVENFAAVGQELALKNPNLRFAILGGLGDAVLCRELAEKVGAGAVNLAGKTTLRQLMAVLKLCRVVITNDTGPMHVAAALGTSVVALFGSTSPELTGPGLPGSNDHALLSGDVPCAPCFLRQCPIDLRCLKGISVDRVVTAASRFLESTQ